MHTSVFCFNIIGIGSILTCTTKVETKIAFSRTPLRSFSSFVLNSSTIWE